MDGQCRHRTNGLKKMQGLVENKGMLMSVCINSTHIFVQTVFVFKNAVCAVSFAIIIFQLHDLVNEYQLRKIPALPNIKFTSPENQSMMR